MTADQLVWIACAVLFAVIAAPIAIWAASVAPRQKRECTSIEVQQWPGIDGPPPEGWGRRV